MKKFLISTAILSVSVGIAAPTAFAAQDGDGNTKATTQGKVGVSFQGDVAPPTDILIGNLVMAYTPTSFEFGTRNASSGPQNLEMATDVLKTKERYIVVNDDRDPAKAHEWQVQVSMTELTNVNNAQDKLNASLQFSKKNISEYHVGEKYTKPDGKEDYKIYHPDGSEGGPNGASTPLKPYTGDMIKGDWEASTEGLFSVVGSANAVQTTVMSRAKGEDEKHSKKNSDMGQLKGGVGYAMSFDNPVLKITTPQKENTSYSADLTWLLTSGDVSGLK